MRAPSYILCLISDAKIALMHSSILRQVSLLSLFHYYVILLLYSIVSILEYILYIVLIVGKYCLYLFIEKLI